MVRDTSNLTRFVESASIDYRLIKDANSEELQESMSKIPARLVESIKEDSHKGWWVPISHYGNYKNGNGRIYNTKLWENVINNQRDTWVGSPMLTDHPAGDSDGNPRDICGVWLDAKFGPADYNGVGIVYGLLVPSGHNGQDLQDHLQNGLRIGTSSSGFGKLMRDGMTVDPDTFQIERLADWVLNPSQGTFFSYDESADDGIIDKTVTSMEESAERDFNESTTIKENVVKDSKITKLEEKKFRRDMESFLESANNIKDPQERLEEFKEIKSYLEEGACPDLKESVEAKIAEQEEEIRQMLAESQEMKEELGIESTKDLKEKLTKIVEDTKLAEKEAKDWKAISEQLQEKLTEANKTLEDRPTNEFAEFQKNKIDSLTEQMKSHDTKASDLVKKLAEAYKKVKESCDTMTEQIKGLEDAKADLEKQNENLKLELDTARNEKNELADHYAKVETEANNYKESIEKYKAIVAKQREKLEESVKKITDLKTLNEKTTDRVSSLAKEAKEAQMQLRKDAVNRVKENRSKMTETEAYYESLYNQYGNEIEQYKNRIANARSLAEAKSYFFHDVLQKLGESERIDSMRIPESISVTPEKRAKALKEGAFAKESVMDRMPKGWK